MDLPSMGPAFLRHRQQRRYEEEITERMLPIYYRFILI